jgi:hypothetical protein
MVWENIYAALRHGDVNEQYFLLGLDRYARPPHALHSHAVQMRVISSQIDRRGAGRAATVLRDKYFFSLVAEALDYPSPRNIALLEPDSLILLKPRRVKDYSELPEALPHLDAFCKPIAGDGGKGCFRLQVTDGKITMDGQALDADDLRTQIDTRYLVQHRVEQHPRMAELYPHAVNSLRLVTASEGGKVRLFQSALRVGAHGKVVDNWGAGGLMIGVDRESGRLSGQGLYKPNAADTASTPVARHPDTGILFDGFEIPFYGEAVDLVCNFHGDIGALATVGWDIAITPRGPTCVEGNTHWGANIHIALDPTFEGRYRELCRQADPDLRW